MSEPTDTVTKEEIRKVLAFCEKRWGFETLVMIVLKIIRQDLGL